MESYQVCVSSLTPIHFPLCSLNSGNFLPEYQAFLAAWTLTNLSQLHSVATSSMKGSQNHWLDQGSSFAFSTFNGHSLVLSPLLSNLNSLRARTMSFLSVTINTLLFVGLHLCLLNWIAKQFFSQLLGQNDGWGLTGGWWMSFNQALCFCSYE